jgi:death-on-curing family protein
MNIPSQDKILAIHNALVEMFATGTNPIVPSGPVDGGMLLGSACSRPSAGYGKSEKYPTLDLKCAALFHSLIKNHPFHNGNKRTALVTLITTLYDNDRVIIPEVQDDDVYNFVIAIATDTFPKSSVRLKTDDVVSAIAKWIKQHTTAPQKEIGEMRTTDFIERCEQIGAKHKLSGSNHIITGSKGAVHFSRSTRKMAGHVVRQYLKRMGYSETRTGITLHEFQDGVSPDQVQIRRFRNVLNRLADA